MLVVNEIDEGFFFERRTYSRSLFYAAIPTVAGECNADVQGYYKVATKHVPTMAADLNEKLMYVRRKGAGRMELIGHCIGAHVVGQAGKLFKRTTGTNIDKIIGEQMW